MPLWNDSYRWHITSRIDARVVLWGRKNGAKYVLRKARFSEVLYLPFFDEKMRYSGDILRTARKVTHLDNDTSCLPIYKKMIIMGMCDTPRQTQCARNYIFPHFVRVMVITVLWAELWFLVGVELCFFFKRVAWEE